MQLERIDALATAQHGVISQPCSGLSRSSWYRAIAAGQLDQLHPGVARLRGTPDTREQRIMAAVLAVGTGALASHRSAAHLWGITRPLDDPVDVIITGRRRLPSLAGVAIHRPKDLERLVPQRRSGIACTNILRTILDLGAVDPTAVGDAIGHALTNGLSTLGAFDSVVIQHSEHGRAGIVALRHAVADWSIDRKPTDSTLETAMHRLIAQYGLPPVEFHPVICGYEVDFRVCGAPIILECDGWTYHGLQTFDVRTRPRARRRPRRRRVDRDSLHLPSDHDAAEGDRRPDRRRSRPLDLTLPRALHDPSAMSSGNRDASRTNRVGRPVERVAH